MKIIDNASIGSGSSMVKFIDYDVIKIIRPKLRKVINSAKGLD